MHELSHTHTCSKQLALFWDLQVLTQQETSLLNHPISLPTHTNGAHAYLTPTNGKHVAANPTNGSHQGPTKVCLGTLLPSNGLAPSSHLPHTPSDAPKDAVLPSLAGLSLGEGVVGISPPGVGFEEASDIMTETAEEVVRRHVSSAELISQVWQLACVAHCDGVEGVNVCLYIECEGVTLRMRMHSIASLRVREHFCIMCIVE